MKGIRLIVLLGALALGSCTENQKVVSGSMKFVLGGTGGTGAAAPYAASALGPVSLIAADEYIVSPRQAKLTFTSVTFKDANGMGLETSELTNCNVVYDRTRGSGTTLLDCPFTVPVGEIHEMQLFFSTSLELLVSDAALGIYSDPTVASGFTTIAPAGGAAFVPYTVTIGGGSTRSTAIVFAEPVTIAEGTSPSLYVTLDMIHTIQLIVNSGGTTLTPKASDPVAVYGGLSPGSSHYFSGASSVEG